MNHTQENFWYLLQQCFQLPVHEPISYIKGRYYDLHDVNVQQHHMPPGEQKMLTELLIPVRGRSRWAGERSWELLTVVLPGIILKKKAMVVLGIVQPISTVSLVLFRDM